MSGGDPWRVASALDRSAKWWWSAASALKLIGFVVGTAGVFSHSMSQHVPYWVAALTLASEVCSHRLDALRGAAQALRRKLEYLDGLGWMISPTELSDLLARLPGSARRAAHSETVGQPYFASTAPFGPQRLLDNLCESAWFSKHLAQTMAIWCAAAILLAVLVSTGALLLAIEASLPPASASATARVVTAVLMLVVSAGLLRLTLGYLSFWQASALSERAAEFLRQTPNPDLTTALKAAMDYQVARAAAPLIPEWLWQLRRNDLNELWAKYRQDLNPPAA